MDDLRFYALFNSFSTVFHPSQDDGRLIMRGCVQWNFVLVWWRRFRLERRSKESNVKFEVMLFKH